MNFKQTVRNLVLIVFLIFLNVMPSSAFSFRNMTLNIVQISDAHIADREDTSYKMLSSSRELLKDAILSVNKIAGLDFVMFTGDMVDIPTLENYKDFFTILSDLNYPSLVTFGNHDSAVCLSDSDECSSGMKINEFLDFVKKCNRNYVFDGTFYAFSPKTDYRIIVLDPVIRNEVTANGYISDEQLAFLDNELAQNQDKVVVIFQHHPPLEPFKSDDHSIVNAQAYLDILKKYKNPIVILSGHYHATKIVREKNIIFINSPSLVSYPNAFRQIKITNYRDRTDFKITFHQTNLLDVVERAKASTIAATTFSGTHKDRDLNFTLRKPYVKPLKKEKVKKEKVNKDETLEQNLDEQDVEQVKPKKKKHWWQRSKKDNQEVIEQQQGEYMPDEVPVGDVESNAQDENENLPQQENDTTASDIANEILKERIEEFNEDML